MTPPPVPVAPPGAPSFTVAGLNLPAGLPDLFGVWHAPATAPGAEAPAFAAPAAGPLGAGLSQPGGPQWQVVLPGDPAAARQLLAGGQSSVEQQRQALRYARRILDDAQSRQKLHRRRMLATRLAAPPAAAPVPPAGFTGPRGLAAILTQPLLAPAAVPALPPPLSPAEALLLQKLNALAALGGSASAAPAAADAPEAIAGITLPWDQAKQFADQWQAFSADVLNLFAHYADIQTAVAAGAPSASGTPVLPIARTLVDWGGNFQTGWLPGLSAERKALHVHAVHLALASRLALVHLVGTVAASAVTLVLASPTVIAFAAALPAVFQAVQGAIQEYLALQHPGAT